MQQGCDRSYLNQRSQCFLLSICCTFIFQKSNQQKFLGLSRPANSVLTGFILVSLLYFIQTFIYLFIIFYIIVVVFFFANALLLFSVLLHDQFFPRLFLSLIGIIVVFRLLARSVRKKKKIPRTVHSLRVADLVSPSGTEMRRVFLFFHLHTSSTNSR